MFGFKKKLDMGIIVGDRNNGLLSFDDYTEHLLLPYSPRFRNIDFAIATLASVGIKNVVVFTLKDSEKIFRYLAKGWPLMNFFVFDYIDAKEKFMDFMTEYVKTNSLELFVIIKGSYPVWINLNDFREQLEKSHNLVVKTRIADREVYSCMLVERKNFIKKFKDTLLDYNDFHFDIEKLADEFEIDSIDTKGYIMPLENIEQFYRTHIDMIDDYHVLDQFNSVVPIKADMAAAVYSTLGKDSHFINSIFGEQVEINGRVENSVIFSGVTIDKNALVKNSIIFPGNHIGSHATIINSIIDEFSEDNTNPNIEHHATVGNDKPKAVNESYPDILNFGVTLIGKDAYIPAHASIGANCYIDSFCGQNPLRGSKVVADGESVFRK